jgi:hypothetical protein
MRYVFYFRLRGLVCGVCGLPALCGEIHPNGVVRTVHMDRELRPCSSLRLSTSSEESQRGAAAARDLPPASASPQSPAVAGRRAA